MTRSIAGALLLLAPSIASAQTLPCELDERVLDTVEQVEDAVVDQYARADVNLNLSLGVMGHEHWAFKGAVGAQVAYQWPIFANLDALCSEDGAFDDHPMGIGPQVGVFTTFTEAYAQVGLRLASSLEGLAPHVRLDLSAVGGTDFDGDLGLGPGLAVGWGFQPATFLLQGHYAFGLERSFLLMFTVSLGQSLIDLLQM